jgi:hypothetical protein
VITGVTVSVIVAVGVIGGVAVRPVHEPSISPCLMWAGTAGASTIRVCCAGVPGL